MKLRVSLALAAGMLAEPSFAQQQSSLLTRYEFVDQEQIARLYPDKAQRMEVGGWATLRCLVGSDATVSNCQAVGESAPGYEFSEAAIRVSAYVRIRPDELAATAGKYAYLVIRFAFGNSGPDDHVIRPGPDVIESAKPPGADPFGMVTLQCEKLGQARERLFGCKVLREFPQGQGFGQAALGLASNSFFASERAVPGPIIFNINWGR